MEIPFILMELFWLCDFRHIQIFGESGSTFLGAALQYVN